MNTTRKYAINNSNRTEWTPIRSVIIRVITKLGDRAAGVRFVYQAGMIKDQIRQHEILLPINPKNYNFREKKNTKLRKGKICIKNFYILSMVIETKVVIG